ncbi:MAG: hypothetical protein M3Y48_25365 [Actinomycetota bacterium]|nr:hypothetical protein [Actinomycetota bacterium]
MSAVASWLVSSVGAVGAATLVTLQPTLLLPLLVTGLVVGGLPLLLIATLALVAVYSPDPVRRAAAEKILDRLLTTLRPQEPPIRAVRRRKKTPATGE